MSIDDLNDLLDLGMPDDDWETVAGFLFGTLEHVPDGGESVELGRLAVHRHRGRRPPHPAGRGQPRSRPATPRRAEPDTR